MIEKKKDLEEAKEKVVNLLNQQTIEKMQSYIRKLKIEIPEEIKEGRKNFFLTENRKKILEKMNDTFSNGGKIFSIHGEFGTGKSTLCQNLPRLCQSGQKFGDEKFSKFTFKSKDIKPIYIHLVRTKKLGDFFQTLLGNLSEIYNKKKIIQSYNNAITNKVKLDEKSRNKLSQIDESNIYLCSIRAPPNWDCQKGSISKELRKKFSNEDISLSENAEISPKNKGSFIIEDEEKKFKIEKINNELKIYENLDRVVENLLKDITNPERAWIIEQILNDLKNNDDIPMLILDEFESLIRDRTELLGFVRNLTRDQMESDDINAIMVISSVRYPQIEEDQELISESEYDEIEADWFERLQGYPEERLDPTPKEARKIMRDIYQYYVIPILEGFAEEGKNVDFWLDKIDEDNTMFPISQYVQKYLTETTLFLEDDRYLKNFRSYKKIIRKLIDVWEFDNDGKGINKEYFWKKSEEIRPSLSEMKGVLMEKLPSRNLIRKLVDNLFGDEDILTRDTLSSILEKLIMEKNESGVVHLSKEDLRQYEIKGFESVESLINFLDDSNIRYFEVNKKQAIVSIKIDDFLKKTRDIGRPPSKKPITEVFNEEFDGKKLSKWKLLELWEKRVPNNLKTTLSNGQNKLVIETNEDFLSRMYITTKEDLFRQIKTENKFKNEKNIQLAVLIKFKDEEKYITFNVASNNFEGEIDKKVKDSIQTNYRFAYQDDYVEDSDNKNRIGLINELKDNYGDKNIGRKYLKLLLLRRLSDNELIKEKVEGGFAVPSRKSLSGFKCKSLGEKWAVQNLAFKKTYATNRLTDIVFALKKASKEESRNILSSTPHKEGLSFIKGSYGRKYTTNPKFNNFLEGFANENEFLTVKEDEVILPNYEYFPRKWKENMNLIEELLKKNEGSTTFQNIKSKLFDCDLTKKIDYHIYTFLVVEEYRENIVIRNEDRGDLEDLKILDPGKSLEEQKERLEEKLDDRVKENLIISVKSKDRKNKLLEITEEYEKLKKAAQMSDLTSVKNIASEVELPQEEEIDFSLIKEINNDKTVSILKAFKKYCEKDKIYTILFKEFIKDTIHDLKLETDHKSMKNKMQKLRSDLERLESHSYVEKCSVSQNLEKKIAEEFSEKVWYDKDIQKIIKNIEEIFDEEFKLSITKIKNKDINEGFEKVKNIEKHFMVKYDKTVDEGHLKDDEEKIKGLKENLKESISQKVSQTEKWNKKLNEYSTNPFYENIYDEINATLQKIKRFEELLDGYKNNPFEKNINSIVDTEEQIESKITEIENKAIEENKEVVKETLSEKGFSSELSFEDLTDKTFSDSLENLAEEISYEELRKWIKEYGKNKLFLSILQKKLKKEL